MVDYNISAVRRRAVFSGSAGVGPYACTFEILTQTDIQVYKNTTLLTLTTDYTVSINSNGTFSVTLIVAATGSDTVTVAGARSVARTTDFVTAGDLRASALNDQLDALTIFDQQMAEQGERSIRFPITDSTSLSATLPIAATRADKFLKFSATGEPGVAAITDVGITAFATAADMTTGTSADTLVSPKELTEWAPAAATLASADSFLVRDASDSLIKRMPALAAITYAMLQDVSATARVLGRKTAAAGVTEEVTLSELLDFIGSAAQGDILYRGASAWARLAAGTSGHFLKTNGAAADPAWAAAAGGFSTIGYNEYTSNADITATIPWDDTIPQIGEGTQILTATVNVPTTTAEVIIMAQGTTSRTSGTSTGITALFNGSSNAIAANINYIDNQNAPANWTIVHRYVPGSSGNVTFTVRTGPDTGTIRLNGSTSARFLGGVSKATLLVFVREP